MTTRQRLIQIHPLDDFDDTLDAAAIVDSENAESLETVSHALLSQIKRIIHGDDEGNWHDNIATVFASPASLKNLLSIASNHFDADTIVVDEATVVISDGNVVVGS